MSCFGADFFEGEATSMSLGSFGGIDTQVHKCGRGIGDCRDIESDRSPVGTQEFPQGGTKRADADGIHSSCKKDTKGSVPDFVREGGRFTVRHKMIHSREGEYPSDFRGAVGDTENTIATLQLPCRLKNQPEDGGADIGDVLENAGEVGGLPVQLRPEGKLEILACDGVEAPGKGKGDS